MTPETFIPSLEWTGREGFDPNTGLFYNYKDFAGIDTIGIGHRNDKDRLNGLTPAQVQALFANDLQTRLVTVRQRIPLYDRMNENQRAAVMAWYFNTGAPSTSPFWSYVNDYIANPTATNRDRLYLYFTSFWITPAALITRRIKERDLFFSIPESTAGGGFKTAAIILIFLILAAAAYALK